MKFFLAKINIVFCRASTAQLIQRCQFGGIQLWRLPYSKLQKQSSEEEEAVVFCKKTIFKIFKHIVGVFC